MNLVNTYSDRKDLGHLLKSPFCVHKATGLICIPLPPEERVYFNPSNAPSLKRVRDQFLERNGIIMHLMRMLFCIHQFHGLILRRFSCCLSPDILTFLFDFYRSINTSNRIGSIHSIFSN